MLFKYYTCNVILEGVGVVGSRIVKVMFFRSPIYAVGVVLNELDSDKTVIDFKRIK